MPLVCTSRRTGVRRAGWSKSPSSKAVASEDRRRTLWYVEDLNDARTMLAAFFSILLSNRLMHRHQLRPIRERPLNLQFMNHLRNARHDILLLEEGGAIGHEG